MQIRKEIIIKLSLFTDNMIMYVEYSNQFTKKHNKNLLKLTIIVRLQDINLICKSQSF
jgi:hypothetical protein